MASRNAYRGESARSSPGSSDPFWLLAAALLALTLVAIALPALVLGFLGWRAISRLFGDHWKLSFLFWVLLLLPAAWLYLAVAQHGLQPLIATQLTDVARTARHAQLDLSGWNFGRLWSETWPVWLRTLPAIPLVGIWQEVSTQARGSQTINDLLERERRRERHVARVQLRARKRALRPERIPNQAGGLMIIGVPIDNRQEETDG